MATAKMKIILPLVVWIWLQSTTTAQSYGGIGFGIKREIFFLNLEDGYFGCQVNESTDVLQLFELSKLCDGAPNCFLGSDELTKELKCTSNCQKEDGTECQNGACLDGQCHCNDGYGGCSCEVPDENECKYRPCDVFSHCTNTLGSFSCTCFPGYQGDGFHCEDIDECQDPAVASRCVANAWCCNLPAHFLCKCNPGFQGDGEVQCLDIDECADPQACGRNALCHNTPGNYTCSCPEGFRGNPFDGCVDVDECESPDACAPGAICANVEGGKQCHCPPGFEGDPYGRGCGDMDECSRLNPCGRDALCSNLEGSFRCACPPGFIGDPMVSCTDIKCYQHSDCTSQQACINGKCHNPCSVSNPCTQSQDCQVQEHQPVCVKVCQCQKHSDCGHNSLVCDGCNCVYQEEPKIIPGCEHCPPGIKCDPTTGACIKVTCTVNEDCPITEACIGHACQRPCDVHNPCAHHAVCINTNHGSDCSCEEGFQGNGYVGCVEVPSYQPICQYNEDCPPHQLCDRLNRRCINPCLEDSCGENAECLPKNHGIECRCLEGYQGNPYVDCEQFAGCRSDEDCAATEACINGQCGSPCQCGPYAICEVIYHQPTCKCPPGYLGNPASGCKPPTNPCDPNPCGLHALCELDNGNPICFCPKGLTGNPFKNCIPEGDDCSPNPCGPNSGCRVVGGKAVCFCLPEYEGLPPQTPCALPSNPCDPSPCGPNTQCVILSNGFAKCTCLSGYLESPNTIRGCVEPRNPCDPNPCGQHALCDPLRNPVCYCPYGTEGNPFKICTEPVQHVLCSPGPCGPNADCYVSNNQEECYCAPGFVGNPYSGCRLEPRSPCVPSPCGPSAQCAVSPDGQSMCTCPDGMGGDPTGPAGCHGYECVVDDNCADSQACIGYRCRDPCPGSCGVNANCRVEQHHPVCTCNAGLTGNPVIRCFPIPTPMPTRDPCMPNPCGLNTICQVMGGRAVCSCLPDFQGDPQSGCQPECVINSDCQISKACLNRHCVDPCAIHNLCGINAECQVRDHTATCICPSGYMGDPFYQCLLTPPIANDTKPCLPSPCGPTNECNIYGGQVAICDPCLGPGASYNPQCRPECLTNADCPFDKACLGYVCADPCPGSCGVNAQCMVVAHAPICSCPRGLVGNPFEHCSVPNRPEEREDTCDNIRCGANADCSQKNKGFSCTCRKGFFGNPWIACRPECVINPDCPLDKSCINSKCVDPCPGVCGVGAQCESINHVPICYCPPHHTGDPFVSCYPFQPTPLPHYPPENPCDPSPCGPFSRCLVSSQGFATCSCLPNYHGAPPACKPECVVSSECVQTRACINQKCVDPCPGTCGLNAICTVINHNPICTCSPGQEGDPFTRCYTAVTEEEDRKPSLPKNPCVPSPCGPNSICQVKEGRPVCSCVANYIGSPPYCRPECVINQECPRDRACVKEKCIDPCINTCGQNAKCDVINHTPICSCHLEYEGDAFIGCTEIIVTPPAPEDPCNPSPCGMNAQCSNYNGQAKCICIPPYLGNPYTGCKPECTLNSDCASHLACHSQHCRNPCEGLCGFNAECTVVNHVPVCTCARGLMGDPFTACRDIPPEPPQNPCEPSPCGPYSVCRVRNDQAICSCQVGYFGTPPGCRPECLVTSECSQHKACINQKCVDPCPGTCGVNARCQVVNHNPICSCPPDYIGDPFLQCSRKAPDPLPLPAPCVPSPCGPNAECRPVDDRPVCSCISGMLGAPPNCRPECAINQDCPSNLACVNNKCRDPCPGSCGYNAQCVAVNHRPTCNCLQGYQGDPFSGCTEVIPTERTPEPNPCFPSPCGPNAECREKNGAGACVCPQGFFGDPYDQNKGCHRECEYNDHCATTLACVAYKCVDPCPGTCGTLAECRVHNHVPTCTCPEGFTGDPFFQCRSTPPPPPAPPQDPCNPSPCGPNSQCRNVNEQGVCSCLPNFIGTPPGCRPECVVSSECPSDKACVNQRCADPCPNTCGLGAQCSTRNHSPICACPPGFIGDPFARCTPKPPPLEESTTPRPASCYPSPCGPNSQCQIIGNTPSCSCLPNYLGAPPNCRPECTISSECSSQLACINQKCRDPCPGSCGALARCHVLNHLPICTCEEGHTGNPFVQCNLIPPTTARPLDPCNPSPCGPNAQCNNGICTCQPEFIGNPYESCRPECVLSTECTRDRACIRNKCQDPCPGTCGQNARCDVINHIPSCSCPDGFTGDPFTLCRVADEIPPRNVFPCNPSPCGPNSQCKDINEHAVCSCLQGYIGSPPSCRPECVVSAECPTNKACVNQKCNDPCLGSCGINARCEVINHSPICSCPEGQTGDPFQSCRHIPPPPPSPPPTPLDPCNPSPCGPNSICRRVGDTPSCSCVQDYIGAPPNCRPECVINPDCPSELACINNKCKDPCPGSCGANAECRVISHTVSCSCAPQFTGNPFVQCSPKPRDEIKPCEPSPCGANAECTERNGAGACACIQDYTGNPYEGCRPECVLSSDCPTNKACIRNKCADPCPGICGSNAECTVRNHVPTCYCIQGYIGDPFAGCRPEPPPQLPTEATVVDPCSPSPCGQYSQCRNVNGQAVCSCLPEYIGSPPDCKPECVVSSECPSNRACHKFKCANPCVGTCGIGARCEVINHNPICSCPSGLTGDPFSRCYELPPPPPPSPRPSQNPCVPSPCGPNSICRAINEQPSCSCRENYVGAPPNCRPECVVNTDCQSNLACITEKCRDPCPGSCGFNAECRVQNHIPVCTCVQGFIGDPFTQCSPKPPEPPIRQPSDPCDPSPCGANAQCNNGICTCLPEYNGDPYRGCRPECTMNTDCPPQKSCSNFKCIDPCPGVCGQSAVCDVINHIPTCSCPPGLEGDPFTLCRNIPKEVPRDPCNPSPCGPNSLCRVNNGVAVCSCQPGLIGSPPSCRPECIVSAECPLTRACLNQKCVDPCPGTCGLNAKCQVVNHNPICSCNSGNTGDPFTRCYPIPEEPRPAVNPCDPSPCGPNSVCQVRGESPACSCLENYVGVPPNCRPECIINPECSSVLACMNQKCRDPCPGSCGSNAVCNVINHNPVCSCNPGYTGDPFRGCLIVPAMPSPPPPPRDPCYPSPCGPNAKCRVENNYAICECLPEYHGNPYENCRPECLANSDCPMTKACIRNKCQDPCPGTCGVSAICTVTNHVPICSCPERYTGDAFRICSRVIEEPKRDPCNPSPCGINTRCISKGDTAICECLPGFFGAPTAGGCRPECTISADCSRDKACVNTKCVDPCPGVCGFNAICNVINHSPVCSCPSPLIGDPFNLCRDQPPEPKDPCNPSPCRLNGQCRVINGLAKCIYPECVINQDCPRDKACYNQKCGDPCRNACGLNALCQVVNHKAVCSCPPDYVGSPEVQCRLREIEVPRPKPECTQNSDCPNDKACINERCVNPCVATPGICAQNAECRAQLHRAVCSCHEGFTGNAQSYCREIGCRTDTECPPTQACVNRDCADPCSYTSCGINALCRASTNHKAQCYCPESYRGDPWVRCDRPECTRDDECLDYLACQSERCTDPCNCGAGAVCRVANHRPQCQCPPGYSGDPYSSCVIEVITPPQCTQDADCASKLACFSGECKNPCLVTKPCGTNADCSVVDTLPLRTMTCLCRPGYVGDAEVECRPAPQEEPGCKSNDECASTEACLNRNCVNPCAVGNPCALSAECKPTNHKATCRCAAGLVGNPLVKCYEQPTSKPECTHDSECSSDKSCVNNHCQDPCITANPCAPDAQCKTTQHRPTCRCPDGWVGSPYQRCYKPGCTTDNDCPYDKACISENCQNPCASKSCGRGAECFVQNHVASCRCEAGRQGDPLLSCITGVCQYNEDCADHEACDRLNRVCRPVCDDDTCADTATCVGQQHQPKCRCPPGTAGNPYIECLGARKPGPECQTDAECPSQRACINERCENPCASSSICEADQECRVLDTLPLRTVMCECPANTIADATGRCKPIAVEPACRVDPDCHDSEKCIRGNCEIACSIDTCGINAICNSRQHQAICTCAPGYTGNPHIECSLPRRPLPPIPVAECYSDSDCSYDRACRNERCINPCLEPKTCAIGAFCSVDNHRAKCSCPAGYTGDPRIQCIPPQGPTLGCTAHSECPQNEACVNQLCVSPCNCDDHSECRVIDHYPICDCRQGYFRDPQRGCVKLGCQSDNECGNDKQCHNGQCVNPCILGHSCAINAECYGHNHRSACRCPPGYSGSPFERCERVECHADSDCPHNRACINQRCVDPCSSLAHPPCAQNAICYAQNHAAGCVCPEHLPLGNPQSFCTAPDMRKECQLDIDCPSKLACIKNQCVNPCDKLSPCHKTAHCSVLDTIPVRTMVCTCPEGWVPGESGECRAVVVPPPGCTSDDDCPSTEACINRLCRNPCSCGTNADCFVQNHRPTCSCKEGYEGNPNYHCEIVVGCRSDSECDSGKACINGNCINPCVVKDPCGINAECYAHQNRAECRCLSGYRGNPLERCRVVGCISNSDCPSDRQCINAQCINPCVYDNPCSSRAECRVQNHMSLCRCPPGYLGNPYVECRPEPQPECREDPECPSRLACVNNKCQDPCGIFEPCHRPAQCEVVGSIPVRTMICVCPPGYISSGSGTCSAVPALKEVGACITDGDCPIDKACFDGICKDPCNCGPNADCRVKDHKPVCTCKQGYDGNPEIECRQIGCRSDDECSLQHACINRQCVPVCAPDQTTCGKEAKCYGFNHRAVCECPAGLTGNPKISCILVGCRSDSECPSNKACVNGKCENPCTTAKPCEAPSECKIYNHAVECVCPPNTVSNGRMGCDPIEEGCTKDKECPSQYACIGRKCVNPCKETEPCGVNADCRVLDTEPVRTMICECLPGYQGNAAVQCDKMSLCRVDKGYIRTPDGKCVCPDGTGLNENDDCVPCRPDKGFKVDERGRCVCAIERGLIIDERGNCVCPIEFGYRLDVRGNCIPAIGPECQTDSDCADDKSCNLQSKTCVNPCLDKHCGVNALCNATDHKAICRCISGYSGDADVLCNQTSRFKTDFPPPEMQVSCLSDGVQVQIHIEEQGFNGVLYVKGHSKDEQCRRIITMPSDAFPKTEIFKVHFGNCGLIHVNGQASFVLVIQKHPKLVTYKAQAYHIKCVYQTGEQNVTLGFNVSMLTTAGTIANTGPPPTCVMKIVTPTGQEINSAEIGDNLMLQVDVQPGSIYGGFARSCVAKTMEDNIENEYLVTDENGCATDPTIFGEWEHNPDTQSLLASFNAFKFPSSDTIRFQCNIRVCFGRCQPVNCRGYNAFGRRKRDVSDENSTDVALTGDLLAGQLREEITISSNAILTFERREERFTDPSSAPNAQRVEDICVSMIGFIIALIITALLALVAVAVAVSCWLMAYRRRPKATGPLPHPPEFPNPLFTTPEPMAEPSPDYLT